MSDVIITADRLFDGTGTAAVVRPRLRVAAGRVEGVDNSLLPPSGCAGERYDFPGCTVIPGLIDTHVHLVFSALETSEEIIAQVAAETDEQLLARARANAEAALRAGLTTVRDCGGRGTVIQRLRDQIRAGEVVACDVLSCGVPITTTRGHCHWLGLIADTPDEVRRAAEKMLAEDADWLKVMATGGNMTASSDPMKAQYDDATLAMLADLGRRAGKYSAAHVLSRSALPGVVAANYRTIEHCNWRTQETVYEFEPELAARIRDQRQYVGLTLSGTVRRAFLPPPRQPLKYASPAHLDRRFECERRMIDFGLPYTLHSDAGVPRTPVERFDLGLRAAVLELKLTPAEAIVAATRTAAEALALDDRGTLTPGRRADLVVVEGNPLQDPECLGKVRAVMKAGRWVAGEVRPASERQPAGAGGVADGGLGR